MVLRLPRVTARDFLPTDAHHQPCSTSHALGRLARRDRAAQPGWRVGQRAGRGAAPLRILCRRVRVRPHPPRWRRTRRGTPACTTAGPRARAHGRGAPGSAHGPAPRHPHERGRAGPRARRAGPRASAAGRGCARRGQRGGCRRSAAGSTHRLCRAHPGDGAARARARAAAARRGRPGAPSGRRGRAHCRRGPARGARQRCCGGERSDHRDHATRAPRGGDSPSGATTAEPAGPSTTEETP
jgi:hypothetical protein